MVFKMLTEGKITDTLYNSPQFEKSDVQQIINDLLNSSKGKVNVAE